VDVINVSATMQVNSTKVDIYKGLMWLALDWRGMVKGAESLGHVMTFVSHLDFQIGKSILALSIKKVEQ
jgi:hypothetical protein